MQMSGKKERQIHIYINKYVTERPVDWKQQENSNILHTLSSSKKE